VINSDEYDEALKKIGEKHLYAVKTASQSFDNDLFWMVVLELRDLGFELGNLRNGSRVRTTIDKNMQMTFEQTT